MRRTVLLVALLTHPSSCWRLAVPRPVAYARVAHPRTFYAPVAKAALTATPKVVPQHSLVFKGQTLTPIGLLMGFSVFSTAFLVQIPVLIAYLWSQLFDEKKRCRGVDWVIHFWARASMTICGYTPEVVGLENLKGIETALFIPNHTSFLDILTLTGVERRTLQLSHTSPSLRRVRCHP